MSIASPIIQNEFFKGQDRDSDVLRIQNDSFRNAMDVRILDVKGKGWVTTNIAGNEEYFQLTEGFVPLGKTEYNGIAYIASLNPTTGAGEVGCFPAPRALVLQDCTQTGFDPLARTYAPLFNFTGAVNARLQPSPSAVFRTTLLNFDITKQIGMFAREDYDNSVNLYLADDNNPNRVINSGFDQNGDCTAFARRYWNNSFPNVVNHINESEKHCDVAFNGFNLSGKLRAGNWHFFIRYKTEDFNPTSFHSESCPVMITSGDYNAELLTHFGKEAEKETDKSVKLNLTNLDIAYSFVEIGYQYDAGGNTEFGLVDKLYDINPTTGSISVEITGHETFVNLGLEDLLKRKTRFDRSKTHTHLENRYFAGNVSDSTNFNDAAAADLLAFAQAIVPEFDDTFTLPNKELIGPILFPKFNYNDATNVCSSVGYFRGESYPFGVVFVFTNGRETEAFPMEGADDYAGAGGPVNTGGVYRFPNNVVSPITAANDSKIMAIQFDVTAALGLVTQYITDNVVGFYFVRGHRNPNLLYQGVTLPCFNATGGTDPRVSLFPMIMNNPQPLHRNDDVLPMWPEKDIGLPATKEAMFPYITNYDIAPVFQRINTAVFGYNDFTAKVDDKWGFYSMDHHFNVSLDINNGHVVEFAVLSGIIPTRDTDLSKEAYYFDASDPLVITYGAGFNGSAGLYNIKEWEKSNNNQYTSYFTEGKETDFDSMFYFFREDLLGLFFGEFENMEIASNKYIGIDTNVQNLEQKLVNIYITDPLGAGYDVEDLYDIKSTSYHKISKYFKLVDVIATPTLVNGVNFYKGDCFLQRVFMKQLFNPKYATGMKDDTSLLNFGTPPGFLPAGIDNFYTYGVSFTIITENAYNNALRHEGVIEKFFPGSIKDIGRFASKQKEKEAEDFNTGYNVILSQKTYLGFDDEIPHRDDKKPAGIIFSTKHLFGSFVDSYRDVAIAAIKEYDFRLGAITKLVNFNGILISIQEEGINRHYVNERAILDSGTSTGELTIGEGDILADKHQNLTDYVGSQHQWSIIETDAFLYGIDFNKRKIWRVPRQIAAPEMLSDSKKVRSLITELCEPVESQSDIINEFPDNPVSTGGIAGYFDRKYNQIGWSFNYNGLAPNRTIVFDEWLDQFYGERSFVSPFYISINEDFISINPNNLDQAWLHDVEQISGNDNYTNFYGAGASVSFVEYVVNQEADIIKVFDNLAISSDPQELLRITYDTQHQKAIHFPFVQNLKYLDPKYEENQWRLPVIRATSITNTNNNIYSVGSRMRGRYMTTKLEYQTEKPIFIKSILTWYRRSYQ